MFLGAPENLWQEVFSRFAAIARMDPWAWFGENLSFAIHPDGYAEPFFVHPAAGRYGCGRRSLAIVYGWNGDALYRMVGNSPGARHLLTRSLEITLVVATMRKVKDTSGLERQTASAFATVPDDPEAEIPVFVSFRPGWMPWHLSRVEVESSAKVLNQALGVFLRAEENVSLVRQGNPAMLWVRRQEGGKWNEGWASKGAFREFGQKRAFDIAKGKVDEVLALPGTMEPVSVDFDVIPQIALVNADAVKLRGEDGRIPMGYFFAIQKFSENGAPSLNALESGIYYPASDIGSLDKFFHDILVKFFIKAKARPGTIVVSTERMRGMLRPLQMQVPFKIVFHEKIPSYDMLFSAIAAAIAKDGAGGK